MNGTKQSLLEGLTYVQSMLNQMQAAMVQYIQLERSFRAKQTGIGTESVKDRSKLLFVTLGCTVGAFYLMIAFMTGQFFDIILLAVAGAILVVNKQKKKSALKLAALAFIALSVALTVYHLVLGMTPGLAIILIVLLAAVVGAEYLFITQKNKRVAIHNSEVEDYNAAVQRQRAELYERYTTLERELMSKTSDWFPPDYYSIEAVDFFVKAVRNGRVDSVKEMVNLFEATTQHQEMVSYQRQQVQQLNQLITSQQDIKRELRFANMIGIANSIQLSGINAGVKNLNTTAKRTNSILGGIASDVSKIKDRIE